MLGSYSYLNGNEKRFSYTTTNTATTAATTGPTEQRETHHFAIQPVDEDIAVLRFFTDGRFAAAKPMPPEFTLTGGPGSGARRTFEGCFFLNWTCVLLQVVPRRIAPAAHVAPEAEVARQSEWGSHPIVLLKHQKGRGRGK